MENEIKIKLSNSEFQRIIKLLGKPIFFKQKNILYKLKSSFIRVRYEKDKIIITFKGPRKKSNKINSRKEIEFSADSDKIIKILKELGYQKTLTYIKYRADYKFKNSIISIDKIGNQKYIEIEGPTKTINEAKKFLGLDKYKIETKSYLDILTTK